MKSTVDVHVRRAEDVYTVNLFGDAGTYPTHPLLHLVLVHKELLELRHGEDLGVLVSVWDQDQKTVVVLQKIMLFSNWQFGTFIYCGLY